jgi:PKD repeat protein
MKSGRRVLSGTLALVLVGLGLTWTFADLPAGGSSAARVAGGAPARLGSSNDLSHTVTVGGPYTPTLSVAVRDLPDEPELPTLKREPVQRDNRGFVGPDIQMPPHGNLLAELQRNAPAPIPDGFATPILNFAGIQDNSSPPDDTGDVGLNHYLQGDNGPNGSRVTIYDKAGALVDQFDMEDLASSSPCNVGYCDPIIQYDELADRWMVSEFDSSIQTLCVYVSKTPDPTGQWWAYAFNPPTSGTQDYPKYAVWPDGYYIAANNDGWVHVLERAKMLNGQAATMQTFNIGLLPGFGFQLTVPATLEGAAPPGGAPAYFLRPRDTEIHGGTCPGCDLMEMWSLHVDWTTPANSALTPLPGIQLTDWDQTLCGTGSDWSCMSQPGTAQKLDPIREPVHYPPQYRNFGTHETLVGCFAEDVDGLDRAAVHWFEIRRTPPGSGNWVNYQEGVLGDGVGDIHHSVCSAAMDSAGNIAVGYTRTGGSAPYYPSIYYSGRRASDPLGVMPYYDNKIWDATTSKTDNERWGDYSGIGVDPVDGCTFWYTTEYGGSGQTRVATFKFDECGTPDFTLNASPDVLNVCVPDDAVYTVDMGAISGFSNTVTLASAGRPAGTTELFAPNPVMPPGESTFTIGNTGGTVPGSYNIDVIGAAAGSPGHQETVVLNLLTSGPEAATLLLPADGAVDQPLTPTFEWLPGSLTDSYTWELDDNPFFTSPLDVATGLTAPTHSLADPLEGGRCYWWRVQGENVCGPGAWADPFHFATAALASLFFDDVEAGGGNWSHQAAQGTDHWAISTVLSHSPTHSWYVPDDSSITDTRLWVTNPIVLSNAAMLTFWHQYQFEGTSYDGSVLEISTNGGGSWTDLGSYIVANGYNGTISSSYSNPLAGRQAWTGDLTTWTQVAVDLSSFAGQSVQVRWRLGCDTSISDVGWYIDDVQIVAALPPNPAPSLESIVPSSGLVGLDTPVTVYGSGFVPTPVLALGETWLVDVTQVSSTTLEAVVPAGTAAGVYDLMLYNGDCQEAVLADAFTLTAGCITPTVTFESDSPVELGQAMHLTATVVPSMPVSYAWEMGGAGYGSGLDTATPVYTYTNLGAYTVTVTAESLECGTSDTDSRMVQVVCYQPQASFISDGPVEWGQPMHFVATVSGTAPMTYAWDLGGAGEGSGLDTATPVFTYTMPGDYMVVLTVDNNCGQDVVSSAVAVLVAHKVYLPLVVREQ